ncbi:MAG TPA: nuclear transport factor 2 family protein [Burkholderiales bacterium]|nr:nuclear transport factor 2 family protein [Burkholderiales bacterium]
MKKLAYWAALVCLMHTVVGCADVGRNAVTNEKLSGFIETINASMPPSSNPEAIANLFAEDGIEAHPFGEPPGGPYRGRAQIKAFFEGFDSRFATWTHVEKSRMVDGLRAVWEGVAQGTDKQTGKFLRLPIVFFFEFDDAGLVKEHRVYLDVHMAAEQLE